jgi:hypothetical protein
MASSGPARLARGSGACRHTIPSVLAAASQKLHHIFDALCASRTASSLASWERGCHGVRAGAEADDVIITMAHFRQESNLGLAWSIHVETTACRSHRPTHRLIKQGRLVQPGDSLKTTLPSVLAARREHPHRSYTTSLRFASQVPCGKHEDTPRMCLVRLRLRG